MEDFIKYLMSQGDDRMIHFVQVDPLAYQAARAMGDMVLITHALGKMTMMGKNLYDAMEENEELLNYSGLDLTGLARFVISTYNLRINIVTRVVRNPEAEGIEIPGELLDEQAKILEEMRSDRDSFRDRSILANKADRSDR